MYAKFQGISEILQKDATTFKTICRMGLEIPAIWLVESANKSFLYFYCPMADIKRYQSSIDHLQKMAFSFELLNSVWIYFNSVLLKLSSKSKKVHHSEFTETR